VGQRVQVRAQHRSEAEDVADRSTWTPAPVFGLLAALGEVPADDVERTFNVGVGMVAVVAAGAADAAVRHLGGRGRAAPRRGGRARVGARRRP
jgi:phosphoribosylaminoimidazole (AIR) synthetase